jgi:hypothetical protein
MKTPSPTKAELSAPSKRNGTLRSSSRQAQYAQIVAMMPPGVARNTMELRRAGVMMPAARIKEMNDKQGYCIQRVALIDLWDDWGFPHPRVAVYSMTGAP